MSTDIQYTYNGTSYETLDSMFDAIRATVTGPGMLQMAGLEKQLATEREIARRSAPIDEFTVPFTDVEKAEALKGRNPIHAAGYLQGKCSQSAANAGWVKGSTMDMAPPPPPHGEQDERNKRRDEIGSRSWAILQKLFPGSTTLGEAEKIVEKFKVVFYDPKVDEFHLVPVGTGINQKLAKLVNENANLKTLLFNIIGRVQGSSEELIYAFKTLQHDAGVLVERIESGLAELQSLNV